MFHKNFELKKKKCDAAINKIKDILKKSHTFLSDHGLSTQYNTGLFQYTNKCLEDLSHIESRFKNNEKRCVIIGRTSTGKSSLLNNFLNEDKLPHSVSKTTAITVIVKKSEHREYLIYDGKEYEVSNLKALNEKILKSKQDTDKLIEVFSICSHNEILSDGIVLVDTMGLDTDMETDNRVFNQLSNGDLTILVETVKGTVSNALRKFMKQYLETYQKFNGCLVFTHLDLISPNEREKFIKDHTEDRLFFISCTEIESEIRIEQVERVADSSKLDEYKRLIKFIKDESALFYENEKIYYTNECIGLVETAKKHITEKLEKEKSEIQRQLNLVNKFQMDIIKKIKNIFDDKFSEYFQAISDSKDLTKTLEFFLEKIIKDLSDFIKKKMDDVLTLEEQESIWKILYLVIMKHLDKMKEEGQEGRAVAMPNKNIIKRFCARIIGQRLAYKIFGIPVDNPTITGLEKSLKSMTKKDIEENWTIFTATFINVFENMCGDSTLPILKEMFSFLSDKEQKTIENTIKELKEQDASN